MNIQHPGFLYVVEADEHVTVYRSAVVQNTDDIYRPIWDRFGTSEPVVRVQVEDPDMMYAAAELLIYEVAA
ncbi:hypothetical protein NN3_21760 [Nocardia neocaledoniensis NBRC 108232]|uniref:Uncharacterized protein n=1 Tax=Nocardia neocaledoniensis TaxID=236511 RepID=A0A317NBU6_9NOCA|nr:hypothetical protein [Nocardia neocaledoniensis]PWV72796.1 hypothetical protein DFR69_108108 [Nocardia neocaledoniensis]GEM31169.1 hypothetical protein NN3_21760 [Nocardia neocaledoniensis NBRC 108232]